MPVSGIIVPSVAVANAIIARIDARAGFPSAGAAADAKARAPVATVTMADPDGTTGYGWTKTCSKTVVHPTDGRFCLICHTWLVTHYNIVRAACQARVTAGTATAMDTSIANLPDAVAMTADWDPPPP